MRKVHWEKMLFSEPKKKWLKCDQENRVAEAFDKGSHAGFKVLVNELNTAGFYDKSKKEWQGLKRKKYNHSRVSF